jgi:hypothetical protein
MKGADYNKAEKRQAKKDGATQVKNSGRGERKGDARTSEILIDYKFTDGKSYSVNIEKFKEFQKESWREQREAVQVAIFQNYGEKALAIIDWSVLSELYELIEVLEEETDNLYKAIYELDLEVDQLTHDLRELQ